jgi:hypothetical protein
MKSISAKTALAVALVCVPAVSAQAATTFTGDKIQGVPVISQLDVNDLEGGKPSCSFLRGLLESRRPELGDRAAGRRRWRPSLCRP